MVESVCCICIVTASYHCEVYNREMTHTSTGPNVGDIPSGFHYHGMYTHNPVAQVRTQNSRMASDSSPEQKYALLKISI